MNNSITKNLIEDICTRSYHYFAQINAIPRSSGNEQAIADYLVEVAGALGLEHRRDHVKIDGKESHNVVIIKPATKGHEAQPALILQAHTDMVCQKEPDSTHDFTKDPIINIIDEKNGQMHANKTTLGADNGIGAAIMLALMERNDIGHPPLYALFTSDEEDGMTGVKALDPAMLDGGLGMSLINFDTEDEGVFYVGCAGGLDATFTLPATYAAIPPDGSFINIEISGLKGGHSGLEIHKQRANAHKLLARTLKAIADADANMRIVSFTGGDKRNVITKEAAAIIHVAGDTAAIMDKVKEQKDIFQHEYAGIENAIELRAKTIQSDKTQALSLKSSKDFVSALLLIPNGIHALHSSIQGLVETSSNLGVVRLEDGQILIMSLIRSFVNSRKLCLAEQMRVLADYLDADFILGNEYPCWEPKPQSYLVKRLTTVYEASFLKSPTVASVHAGLECGYFAEKFPGIDMVSMGPNISGAHTPKESLDLNSMPRVMELLLGFLATL